MGTIIGNIAYGASPSQEDFRVFETQSALNTYLSSARAKAGQTVKLKDTATGKYKAYIIQGTAGNFTTVQMGGSYVVASSLPEVSNADEDTDYYIGTSATGYVHYRLIGGDFRAVGGDTSGIEDTISDINTALAGKGVALSLEGTTLMLLDSNQTQLGEAIPLPPTGLSSLYMQTVTEQVDGESKVFLEILESSTSSEPLARCELPAMGESASALDYNVRLYNRTGGSTTFATSSSGTTKITVSFHETDIDGVQTAQSGNISVYYKNPEEADSAYRLFRQLIIPQDTNTDIDVSSLTNVAGTTTNIKVVAYGSNASYSRELVYNITAVEVGLSSNSPAFPSNSMSTTVFTAGSTATLLYTPVGNRLHKTMHFIMDGNEILTTPEQYDLGTASNVRKSITIDPEALNLSYGAHYFRYYFTTSEGATSPVLYNVFLYDDGREFAPIVAIDKSTTTVAPSEVVK